MRPVLSSFARALGAPRRKREPSVEMRFLESFIYYFLYLPYLIIQYLRPAPINRKTLMRVRGEMLRMLSFSLRYHGPEYRLPKLNQGQDLFIGVVLAKLCGLNLSEEARAFEAKNGEIIDKEMERIKAIPEITKDVALFHKVLAAAFYAVGAHDEANEREQRAKSFDERVPQLSRRLLFFTEARAVRQQLVLRRKLAARSSLKLDLSQQDIGVILTVLSSLFLISGFLYNKFLLGAFGIDVSLFFSLSDYLAASIEKIRYSALGGLVGLGSLFLAMDKLARLPPDKSEREVTWSRIESALILVAFGYITARTYIDNSPYFYPALSFFLMLLGVNYSFRIADRYFKNVVVAHAAIVFLIVFSAYMFGSVALRINEITHSATTEDLKVHLVAGTSADLAGSILITANSSYYFFYNREKRRALVLPNSQVVYVDTSAR